MKICILLFVFALVRGQESESDENLRGLRPPPRPSPPSAYRPMPNNYGKPPQYATKPAPSYTNRPAPSYEYEPTDSYTPRPASPKPPVNQQYGNRPYKGPSSYSPVYPPRPFKQYSFVSQYPPFVPSQQPPTTPAYPTLPLPQPHYPYSPYGQHQFYPGGNTLLLELLNELIDRLNQNNTATEPPTTTTTTTTTTTPSTITAAADAAASAAAGEFDSSAFASFANLFSAPPMMNPMFASHAAPATLPMMMQNILPYPIFTPNTTMMMMPNGTTMMMSAAPPSAWSPSSTPMMVMAGGAGNFFMRDSPAVAMVDPRSPMTSSYEQPSSTYSHASSQNSHGGYSSSQNYNKPQRPAYNHGSPYSRPTHQRPTSSHYMAAHQSSSSPAASSYVHDAQQAATGGSQHYQAYEYEAAPSYTNDAGHNTNTHAAYPAEEPMHHQYSSYSY